MEFKENRSNHMASYSLGALAPSPRLDWRYRSSSSSSQRSTLSVGRNSIDSYESYEHHPYHHQPYPYHHYHQQQYHNYYYSNEYPSSINQMKKRRRSYEDNTHHHHHPMSYRKSYRVNRHDNTAKSYHVRQYYRNHHHSTSCDDELDIKPIIIDNDHYIRDSIFEDLPLEWWERNDECKDAKSYHLDRIDMMYGDREELVLQTTLHGKHTTLERNMFPYDTPVGVEHYTLWCRDDLRHNEIVHYVDSWLKKYLPHVRRWQYDDNSGERSISLFHVHVFVETDPYSFTPRKGEEYYPPHAVPPHVEENEKEKEEGKEPAEKKICVTDR